MNSPAVCRCWKRSIPATSISALTSQIPCRCSPRPPAPSSPISRKKPPRLPPRRFWWLQKSPIRTVADLRGKKVAVTKGAGSHFLLLAALANAGLSFKDISPAYLTPADGRTAFIGGNVDAWVAWDPFLTSAQRQSNARVLSDGSNGLASYKRYYLSSAAFADRRSDVLNAIFGKLDETGKWVKAHPKEAATLLAGLWGIDAATVEEANSHRSYKVGVVTPPGLSEQQRIADAFFAEGLLPVKVDAGAAKIWTPKRD